MSLQTKAQLLKTLQLNTKVPMVTDLKQQLESLEKSTQAVQQRSVSNRNKIRELDHMLQELDTTLDSWLTITDNRHKEQQKKTNRLQENNSNLWWLWCVTASFTFTAFILVSILWFR